MSSEYWGRPTGQPDDENSTGATNAAPFSSTDSGAQNTLENSALHGGSAPEPEASPEFRPAEGTEPAVDASSNSTNYDAPSYSSPHYSTPTYGEPVYGSSSELNLDQQNARQDGTSLDSQHDAGAYPTNSAYGQPGGNEYSSPTGSYDPSQTYSQQASAQTAAGYSQPGQQGQADGYSQPVQSQPAPGYGSQSYSSSGYGQPNHGDYSQPNYGQAGYTNPVPPNPFTSTPHDSYSASGYSGYQAAMTGPVAPNGMPLANWGKRALSALIDYLAPSMVVSIIGGFTGAFDPYSDSSPLTIITQLLYLVWFCYNTVYLGGTTGQSWGRKIAGTRLLSEATGRPTGIGMAFVRQIAHGIDVIICYIGYLFPLWDAKRQTLADKIVGTIVVDEGTN